MIGKQLKQIQNAQNFYRGCLSHGSSPSPPGRWQDGNGGNNLPPGVAAGRPFLTASVISTASATNAMESDWITLDF